MTRRDPRRFRARAGLIAVVLAALAVPVTPAGAAPDRAAAAPAAAPVATAPTLPTADGVTLPCANTSLNCVTLRFDNPSPSYLATKHMVLDYMVAGRRPSYMADPAVAKQFAWRIDTNSTSPYVMIREAYRTGRCLAFGWSATRLESDCSWTDKENLWSLRPVGDGSRFQILSAAGECLTLQDDFGWATAPQTCVSPDAAAEEWQVFTAQGDQQRLFTDLAVRHAFSTCFDTAQTDTGRCDFAVDRTAPTPSPVVREQCARTATGAFPLTNNSDTAQEFTLSTERSSTNTTNWKDAFKGSAGLDGLLGKVLKVSAEYTKEWGGSVAESTKETESRKLSVGPHRKAWVFYRDIQLPVPGVWTFEKGTAYAWTYGQTASIDVVGSGNLTRERVDNFVPTSELTPDWTCTTRGAPEITGGRIPVVDTGTQSTAPTVGQRISTDTGTWNVAGDGWTYGYQWRLNDQAVPGANAASYQVRPADAGGVLTVQVSAAHPGYVTGYAVSTRTLPVVPGPAASTSPTPVDPAPAPNTPVSAPTTATSPTGTPTAGTPTTGPSTTPVTTSAASPSSPTVPAPSSTAPPGGPAPGTATIRPDSADPSTAQDPLSVMVRLVTRPATQFRGQAVLLDGDDELDRHPVFAPGTIATDTFVLPSDLTAGSHELTVRFVPDDPTLFAPAEATVTVQVA
ncbi:hypothetical protein JL107_10250 [Nakamurella flavida]|uniref:Ricin B lectin domain-containing protein n=1 Tax=Nakamurella flavida TaxID=363630 RepID=A0A938YIY5_9ACTN|nr:hypothetical protein [Nakamurella flavida]MBM9476827.1 hypothetical protein [Nakamurella flavida]MDP9778731.1 hypothetical protein [Nakamurella flavida]